MDRTSQICWVCGQETRATWRARSVDLNVVECTSCAHLQAVHASIDSAPDYHLNYDQGDFVASLGVTRKRQAERILNALQASGPVDSLLDFGCGRGWFLAAAKARGVERIVGADVSDVALDLLRQQGILTVKLDDEQPFERLTFSALGFVPETICFLDVIEHFRGDLTQRLRPWFAALPSSVRRVVIKVPVRDGLLFGIANMARRVGIEGPARQLFQYGTFPPHYQYFSRNSLERFVSELGFKRLAVLDDLDFEPELLAGRLASVKGPLAALVSGLGRLLGWGATLLRRTDSRIAIVARV
jgi:SAM-dependent methyltransferase